MSYATDLPASAVRLFKGSAGDNADGIGTPAQGYGFEETWQVPLADATAFFNTVFGSLEVVGGPSGIMVRRVPLRHPEYPTALATGYRSTRVGFNSTAHFWSHRNITVSFRSPNYDLSGQNAFISVTTSPSVRSIPAPAVAFRVGGVAPVYDPGFEIQGTELTLTMHQVQTLPTGFYSSYQRCVNNATFWGYATGCVLYQGPRSSDTNTIAGRSYEVAHVFDVSTIPWNYGFLPDGTLGNVTYNGNLRFPEANLTALFS